MIKLSRTVFAVTLMLVVVGVTFVFAQSRKTQLECTKPFTELEGIKRYNPSRLEWLELKLNVFHGKYFSEGRSYAIGFVGNHFTDTINIVVTYNPGTDRAVMDDSVEYAKKKVEEMAKDKGWDKWLTIRERVKMVR